ncbi:hypothetical protein CFAM422_003079 [Trichoderma lentiforme]|uniref:F-box domain-containing protein n=1 Tax=Trichoderma lentiforme TaxID=1567552 RepID=A0A9P4XIS9_9HYPO|nr:hypothetical protein CFAM422_003079 [Trichoderma lentiforme]
MTSITKLPCEVMTSIMRELGNIRFLLPCLLTCRYFYACFKADLHLAADILEQQLTPALVPYAIAVLEASQLNPRTGIAVRELLETFIKEPSKLRSQFRTLSVPLLVKIGRLHDPIQSLATQFANNAWAHIINDQGSQTDRNICLSATENYRFCRAFYKFELFCNLFRSTMPTGFVSVSDEERRWFFAQYAPWENEQLTSVHDFLELKLSEGSYDVLAHDVEFGTLGIDYLTAGGDNGWRQVWLSQGIDFIYRMTTETSYDAKKALLKSSYGASSAYLYDALTSIPEVDLDDDTPLAQITDEDLKTMIPTSNDQDIDKGPFEAWRVAFKDLPRSMWVMLTKNSGLRERAYVFWNLDRLERYDLLELFKNAPEDSELLRAVNGWGDMFKSFEERSKIKQRGGSGYWSKDDESRIVWPARQAGGCLR